MCTLGSAQGMVASSAHLGSPNLGYFWCLCLEGAGVAWCVSGEKEVRRGLDRLCQDRGADGMRLCSTGPAPPQCGGGVLGEHHRKEVPAPSGKNLGAAWARPLPWEVCIQAPH